MVRIFLKKHLQDFCHLAEWIDMKKQTFEYDSAFSRNLGWITESEFQILKTKKVAIAGCGGVGGHHAEILARLGICHFVLADFDQYEIQNFNRQNGATISNIGKNKIDVIASKILDINPEAQITKFSNGIDHKNMDSFLDGVDIYIDGLDFYAIDARIQIFQKLKEKNIPSLTVAPAGMGAAMVIFDKDSMSFEDYFGMSRQNSSLDNCLKFLAGLAPKFLHSKYLMDPTKFDFINKKAPSTPMGCYISSGVAVTNALKILLNRPHILKAPWSIHYDSYLNKISKTYVFGGARNPFQLLKFYLIRKKILSKSQTQIIEKESIFEKAS